MREVYVLDEGGVMEVGYVMDDLDILVEVINGYVKESNWWVVVECWEKGIDVGGIVSNMRSKVKEYLKGKGLKDYFVKEDNWELDYVSSNIMNSDVSYVVINDEYGSECFRGVEDLDEEGELSDEEYDSRWEVLRNWRRECVKEVELEEEVENIIGECIDWMGNEDGGELKNIVNGVLI